MNEYIDFAEYEALESSPLGEIDRPSRPNVLSAAELFALPVPEREWVWESWLPLGTTSLLGGPAGAGKSYLAQTIALAVSMGLPLFGAETKMMSTMYLTCEDDEGELIRRGKSIATSLGLSLTDFNDCYLYSKVGDEHPAICGRGFKKTASYSELDQLMGDLKLQLVFLDVIPDFWEGNEIVRQEVNRFVKGFLGKLAIRHNACIVGLHHPSVAGQASGEGRSGSTAWEGSVRSRLYLSGADKDGIRKLSLKKSNYSSLHDINLFWEAGSLKLSSETYSDPKLIDGSRQRLGQRGSELRELLISQGGEMTLDEGNKAMGSSTRIDAMKALENRGIIEVVDGVMILLEP